MVPGNGDMKKNDDNDDGGGGVDDDDDDGDDGGDDREIKIHVYSIRQTANVSGEFLRIENKQLKKVQNDSCGQNYHKTTYFCVEAINSKRKTRGKLGHVVQIHVCRLA